MNCESATVAHVPVSKRLESEVLRLATTPRTTISIVGAVGTGKQAWARRLHAESARREAAFVVLEPGEALQQDAFERAKSGSLYLRDTTRLSAEDQLTLLGILAQAAPETPRILAGSRILLENAVAAGDLRHDLEYRLNVLSLEIPPLRERLGELGALAVHLTARLARRLGMEPVGLEPGAEAILCRYDWPGNLHELAWRLEGALIQRLERGKSGPISPDEVQTNTISAVNVESLMPNQLSLDAVEEQAIRRALEASSGNRSLAARQLGIHRTTLYHKMRRFGLR